MLQNDSRLAVKHDAGFGSEAKSVREDLPLSPFAQPVAAPKRLGGFDPRPIVVSGDLSCSGDRFLFVYRHIVRERRPARPKSRTNMPDSTRLAELPDFDPAEHLKDEADIAADLNLVVGEGDSAELAHALGVIARARGMTDIAKP